MLGILGSIFGVLGIFTIGVLFIPLGLLCTLFSFIKGEILLGIVSLAANIVAILVSPSARVFSSAPPLPWFYRGDNYSDAGGYIQGTSIPRFTIESASQDRLLVQHIPLGSH